MLFFYFFFFSGKFQIIGTTFPSPKYFSFLRYQFAWFYISSIKRYIDITGYLSKIHFSLKVDIVLNRQTMLHFECRN